MSLFYIVNWCCEGNILHQYINDFGVLILFENTTSRLQFSSIFYVENIKTINMTKHREHISKRPSWTIFIPKTEEKIVCFSNKTDDHYILDNIVDNKLHFVQFKWHAIQIKRKKTDHLAKIALNWDGVDGYGCQACNMLMCKCKSICTLWRENLFCINLLLDNHFTFVYVGVCLCVQVWGIQQHDPITILCLASLLFHLRSIKKTLRIMSVVR